MKLIENWRSAHKFASVRLAAIAGVIGGYFASNPEQLVALIDWAKSLLPESIGPLVPIIIGLLVTTVSASARVTTFKSDQ